MSAPARTKRRTTRTSGCPRPPLLSRRRLCHVVGATAARAARSHQCLWMVCVCVCSELFRFDSLPRPPSPKYMIWDSRWSERGEGSSSRRAYCLLIPDKEGITNLCNVLYYSPANICHNE
eukprot:gene7751-5435_t